MAENINAKIKKKRSEALRALGKGKIDKAIEIYEDILKVKEEPDICNAIGDLYVRKQNISKAVEYYERSFKLYKEEEFLDNAVAVVRKILKYEKDRRDLYLELADLYTELGNQDGALDALESVITDDIDPSMLERAFTIINELAEKVQEDESSVQRFERLFIKLQEISERFGEISLESGMGMEMSSEEDLFSKDNTSKESEEEGLILEEAGEKGYEAKQEVEKVPQAPEIQEEESQEEGLVFEEEGASEQEEQLYVGRREEDKETTKKDDGSVLFKEEVKTDDIPKRSDNFYGAAEPSTEDLVFEEEEPETEPVISEMGAEEESVIAQQKEETKEEIDKETKEETQPEISTEPSVDELSATGSTKETESRVKKTEEIIRERPLEREKPPTTSRYQETKGKYYEEFKDIILTFIEEMGEADINELYDFERPFDTAMTLYKMELYDLAISEFQTAMRDSEYRLRAMEMIGRIFFEMNNYEMAIKMLLKALDEGGYEEHEYIGIRYYLGRSYEATGLEDEALEQYEQIYLIDKNYKDLSERIDSLRLKRVKSF